MVLSTLGFALVVSPVLLLVPRLSIFSCAELLLLLLLAFLLLFFQAGRPDLDYLDLSLGTFVTANRGVCRLTVLTGSIAKESGTPPS